MKKLNAKAIELMFHRLCFAESTTTSEDEHDLPRLPGDFVFGFGITDAGSS